MFCKQDMSPFSEEEQENLLKEINSLLPKEIKFANDGIFSRVVYLKAKNYVMVDSKGKRKVKGSALKSSTLEPALKQMLAEMVDLLIADKRDELKAVYNRYLEAAQNITDIRQWATKKTLSPTTFNSERKNETDIVDAIKGRYSSGDRVYLYTNSEIRETGEVYKRTGLPKTKRVKYLCLVEDFDGNYCKDHYIKRVKDTAKRFETVLGKDFFK